MLHIPFGTMQRKRKEQHHPCFGIEIHEILHFMLNRRLLCIYAISINTGHFEHACLIFPGKMKKGRHLYYQIVGRTKMNHYFIWVFLFSMEII